MRNSQKAWIVGALLALLWLPAPALLAQTEDPESYVDDYQAGNFGRVRFHDNGVTIVRADPELAASVREADGVNAPIFPGDSITTGPDQRVEVQLAGGALVRLDRRTDLTFLALPDPYADFPDHTVLQLGAGTIRLEARLSGEEELRVDTPASTVYVLGDADVRIEASESGRTRVFSRRGVVEVAGSGGSVILRGGMRTEVHATETPYDPVSFNTFATDGFDLWVEQRAAAYQERYDRAGSEAYRQLPTEVRPYYVELSNHGSWIDTEDYGYVWYPRDAPRDWRPYHDGYWDYGPHGYFWVSREPWGWAPYHYGRWSWIGGHGWCWIPGRVFAGAWVSWSWGPVYVGWSPLDYWNRPAYRATIYYDYYDPYAWTFISYRHIVHHDYVRYSVSLRHVGTEIHRAAIVTRPPKVHPRRLADSPETRERTVRELQAGRERRPPTATSARGTGRSFSEHEERLVRSGSRSPRQRDPVAGNDRATRTPPAGARADTSTPRTPAAETPRYPRRSSPGATDARPSARPRAVTPRTRGSNDRPAPRSIPEERRSPTSSAGDSRRKTSLPQVRPRQVEPRGTNERLRDLYRKMAQPRPTREQPKSATADRGEKSPRAAPPTRSRPTPRSGGEKSRTKPKTGSSSRDKKDDRASPAGRGVSSRQIQAGPPGRTPRSATARRSAPGASPSSRVRASSAPPRPSRAPTIRGAARAPSSSRASSAKRSAPQPRASSVRSGRAPSKKVSAGSSGSRGSKAKSSSSSRRSGGSKRSRR